MRAGPFGDYRQHDRRGDIYRRPIAWGASVAFVATIATWFAVVGLLGALSDNVSALAHPGRDRARRDHRAAYRDELVLPQDYWAGWIGMHTQKKQKLIKSCRSTVSRSRCSGSPRSDSHRCTAKDSRWCFFYRAIVCASAVR